MKHTTPRALTMAAAGVIVALTVAAFWLSYAHLQSVAATYGLAASPARAWAWPATLDLFIVAGELLLLRASLTARTDWWAIGLTVTGSGGSIALNISGVGAGAHILDYVVAAVPPTAALLAFGALMRQVHDHLATTTAPATPAPAVTGPAPAPGPDRAAAPPAISAAQPAVAPASVPAAAVSAVAADTGSAPAAPAAPHGTRPPGTAKVTRPVRTDDELLAHLRELRTGADAPLSQRSVLAALGIGLPRLRTLLTAHGLTLDPLPAAHNDPEESVADPDPDAASVLDALVDLYATSRMDGDHALITGALEACIAWDEAHPEFNGLAMARTDEIAERTPRDAFRED